MAFCVLLASLLFLFSLITFFAHKDARKKCYKSVMDEKIFKNIIVWGWVSILSLNGVVYVL